MPAGHWLHNWRRSWWISWTPLELLRSTVNILAVFESVWGFCWDVWVNAANCSCCAELTYWRWRRLIPVEDLWAAALPPQAAFSPVQLWLWCETSVKEPFHSVILWLSIISNWKPKHKLDCARHSEGRARSQQTCAIMWNDCCAVDNGPRRPLWTRHWSGRARLGIRLLWNHEAAACASTQSTAAFQVCSEHVISIWRRHINFPEAVAEPRLWVVDGSDYTPKLSSRKSRFDPKGNSLSDCWYISCTSLLWRDRMPSLENNSYLTPIFLFSRKTRSLKPFIFWFQISWRKPNVSLIKAAKLNELRSLSSVSVKGHGNYLPL